MRLSKREGKPSGTGNHYSKLLVAILFTTYGLFLTELPGCGLSILPSQNVPPVVLVTPISSAKVGEIIELNGCRSYDPDGDTLAYHWQQDKGPAAVVLENSETSTAVFTPLAEGDYQFSLSVSDGHETAETTIEIQVVMPVVAKPIFDPPEEIIFRDSLSVTISCDTSGAEIFYTLDGTEPFAETGILYKCPVLLTDTGDLKAIAVHKYMKPSGVTQVKYTHYDTVASPTFDPPDGGIFKNSIIVHIQCETEGATVYYTTNSSSPNETNGHLYTGPISLTDTTTLKAAAFKDGMFDSLIASASYSKHGIVLPPKIDPETNRIFKDTLTVSISCATPDAKIYYALDGSLPDTSNGQLYTGPLQLTDTTTLKTLASKEDMFDSDIAEAVFTRWETVATPKIFPEDPFFQDSCTVTITCATPGATIYYTTDDKEAGPDHGNIYTGPFTLTSCETVHALACHEGMFDSQQAHALYTRLYPVENPVFSPAGGLRFDDSVEVQITCETQGATIRYTLDGSTPDESNGIIYTSPIFLTETSKIKAMATKYAMIDTPVVSATYTKVISGIQKWTYETGGIIDSSPAIGTDGTIYFGSFDCKLYAIQPNGSRKWSFTTGGTIFSSPAIGNDGTVYVGSMNGHLYALTSAGKLKWEFNAVKPIVASPVIATDGTIYFNNAGSLFAIDASGTQKWQYLTTDSNSYTYSSPAIGPDGTIYVGTVNKLLHAVSPEGVRKWTFETSNYIDSSPAIDSDGTIYVGSGDRKLWAIHPNGSLKWFYKTAGYIDSSPVIGADGTIYIGSADASLYAIDPDGRLKWAYPTGGPIRATPTVGSDGTIYISSLDRGVYALTPDGTLSWSVTTEGEIDSSPAISDEGMIYVGSKDHRLYAITCVGRLAETPWPRFHRNLRQTGNVHDP